jgi:peptidyl-tRNA hydrolase, PTH1 family
VKYLIAGLGNIGDEYRNTRHNIGFLTLDALARASNVVFQDKRYGAVGEFRYKARTYILLKPSTFMNRSGNAVRYWLKKENIPVENLLVILDDIALPFGTLRLKPHGGDAGHNGLKSINEILGHQNYARLRVGIGHDFNRGQQVDYVLGNWTPEDIKLLEPRFDTAAEIIKSFGAIGIQLTMTRYNNR